MNEIKFKPIGVIHSPFKDVGGMPIQPAGAPGIQGTVEIFPEYCNGLKDLEGFSHIILIYHFHLVNKCLLNVKPFLDDKTHGIFATRSPARPNPIGLSLVRLLEIREYTLYIENIDIVDTTPLLDIKPYVPDFDSASGERIGWVSGKTNYLHRKRSDGRFAPE